MPRFILLLLLSGIHLLATVNSSAQTEQAGKEQPQRITRDFKVDVARIAAVSQKAAIAKQDNAITAKYKLQRLLGAAGITQPIQMEVDAKAGLLRVTAPQEELELIPAALKLIAPELVLVELNVKHLEIAPVGTLKDEHKEFFEDLSPIDSVPWQEGWLKIQNVAATNVMVEGLFRPNLIKTLSDQQHRSIIRALEQRDGVDVGFLSRSTMTTNRIIYAGTVHNYAKATAFTPGYSYTPSRIEDEALMSGVLVIVEGRVRIQPDRKTITLDWIARITQMLDFHRTIDIFSTSTPMNTRIPKFRVRHVVGSTQMKDGETLMVGVGKVGTPKADKFVSQQPALILTLTPRLLGLDGKSINP
jgi:hypothetical protein